MIIDQHVAKIGRYEEFHPGGVFTLRKNYGRDISKYFIGAYKLVNTAEQKLLNRSATAVSQTNNMLVATL